MENQVCNVRDIGPEGVQVSLKGRKPKPLHPADAVDLINLLAYVLMQRQEPVSATCIQMFALASIEPYEMPDGTPGLHYKLENQMEFATRLPREKMEALHRELGELLAKTAKPLTH